jgi:hypothetical protein
MNGHMPFLRKYLWELKIPLKIKFSCGSFIKKIVPTNYKLVKRNWNGCKKCFFLVIPGDYRAFVSLILLLVHIIYALPPPTNIINMFGNWLNGIDEKIRLGFALVLQLYVGRYGTIETTSFLTRLEAFTLCTLSI